MLEEVALAAADGSFGAYDSMGWVLLVIALIAVACVGVLVVFFRSLSAQRPREQVVAPAALPEARVVERKRAM